MEIRGMGLSDGCKREEVRFWSLGFVQLFKHIGVGLATVIGLYSSSSIKVTFTHP